MPTLILRKRGPRRRLRHRGLSTSHSREPLQGPLDRLDFDEEAIELIGPGNERPGDGA